MPSIFVDNFIVGGGISQLETTGSVSWATKLLVDGMPNCINLLVVNFLDLYIHTPFFFFFNLQNKGKKKKIQKLNQLKC